MTDVHGLVRCVVRLNGEIVLDGTSPNDEPVIANIGASLQVRSPKESRVEVEFHFDPPLDTERPLAA